MKDKSSKTKPIVKKTLVSLGVISIHASFNNTIISVSDLQGNVLCWSSAGKNGFKGSRKSTPYAAQLSTQSAVEAAKIFGLHSVTVNISGPGVGRESSLRAVQSSGLVVLSINDLTYHPHNGCRPSKRRRV